MMTASLVKTFILEAVGMVATLRMLDIHLTRASWFLLVVLVMLGGGMRVGVGVVVVGHEAGHCRVRERERDETTEDERDETRRAFNRFSNTRRHQHAHARRAKNRTDRVR